MKRDYWRVRRLTTCLVVAMLLLGLASTAHATVFVDSGTIAAGETINDDAFVAGDRVIVEGTVNGDLFAVGGEIQINGAVAGSVFAAGQVVEVNGQIMGSLYAGASNVTLGSGATVGRNLYFGGYALNVQRNASIGQDVVAGGYQAQIGGQVGDSVMAGLGALEVSGTVNGDIRVEVAGSDPANAPPPFWAPPGVRSTLAPGLRVLPGATIGGRLIYKSPMRQDASVESKPGGGVVYQTPEPSEQPRGREQPQDWTLPAILLALGRWIIGRIREFVTLLIFGGLALWLIPRLYAQTAEVLRRYPWPSLGWGFLAWVAGLVAAGVLAGLILVAGLFFGFITLGGLAGTILGVGFSALGLAFSIFVLLVQFGSKLVVALVIGRLLMEVLAPKSYPKPAFVAEGEVPPAWSLPPAASANAWPWLLGILLYVVVCGVPFLGWLVRLVVTFFGLGAIVLRYRDWRSNGHGAAVEGM